MKTQITPAQMLEALKIINESWVMMTGEDFARHCLKINNKTGSNSWANENFRRFQNDLGAQINKSDGDYIRHLAAGLVEFYNNK